jgi:AraC family ethanolamine operon transcriptional activator
MKKNRTANLHHLYHEVLPEDVKLTPKVEVDNVHQRRTTDVYEHADDYSLAADLRPAASGKIFMASSRKSCSMIFGCSVNTPDWRCVSHALSGQTHFGLAFPAAASRDLLVSVWVTLKLPPAWAGRS